MESATAEMQQIHWRNLFDPKHYHELTPKQKSRVVESFQFFKEKSDGRLKDQLVLGGNVQRDYITKDEASSPTAYTEAVIITCIIEAKENRDVATLDCPNAFCNVVITDEDARHRFIVRLQGVVVDILLEIDYDFYNKYVTINKKGEKVLLVQCMNALYGIMVASLMFYEKLVAALKSYGFEFNPYDACVANKTVDGSVVTICFHVDDCKISCVSLACYVADMSPTCVNVAKSWPTLCVVATQKSPRHTQFISITATITNQPKRTGTLAKIEFLCLSSNNNHEITNMSGIPRHVVKCCVVLDTLPTQHFLVSAT